MMAKFVEINLSKTSKDKVEGLTLKSLESI